MTLEKLIDHYPQTRKILKTYKKLPEKSQKRLDYLLQEIAKTDVSKFNDTINLIKKYRKFPESIKKGLIDNINDFLRNEEISEIDKLTTSFERNDVLNLFKSYKKFDDVAQSCLVDALGHVIIIDISQFDDVINLFDSYKSLSKPFREDLIYTIRHIANTNMLTTDTILRERAMLKAFNLAFKRNDVINLFKSYKKYSEEVQKSLFYALKNKFYKGNASQFDNLVSLYKKSNVTDLIELYKKRSETMQECLVNSLSKITENSKINDMISTYKRKDVIDLIKSYEKHSTTVQECLVDALSEIVTTDVSKIDNMISAYKRDDFKKFLEPYEVGGITVMKNVQENLMRIVRDLTKTDISVFDKAINLFETYEKISEKAASHLSSITNLCLEDPSKFDNFISTFEREDIKELFKDYKKFNHPLVDTLENLVINDVLYVNDLREILSLSAGAEEQALMSITEANYCSEVVWNDLIMPTFRSQKVGAFLCLDEFNNLYEMKAFDVNLLKYISTQKGVKAWDLLRNVVKPLAEKSVDLSAEKEIIKGFVDDVDIPVVELYQDYKDIFNSNFSRGKKKEKINALSERVTDLHGKIVNGECGDEDFDNKYFGAVLYFTFPPATTIDREQYLNLIEQRESLPIPNEFENLQNFSVGVACGSYKLKDNEKADVEPWQIIYKANNKKDLEKNPILGEEIISLWCEGELNKNKEKIIENLVAEHKANGHSLPDNLNSHHNLMSYKEFVGDTLKDLIDSSVNKYKESDSEEFNNKLDARLSVKVRNPNKLAKTVYNVINNNDEDRAKNILSKQLSQYFPDASKEDLWNSFTNKQENEIAELLQGVRVKKNHNRKVTDLIYQDLIGQDYSKMQREMQKYEFDETESAEQEELKFMISKKKEHSAVGLNMGVCTAPDQKLWERPDFMNMIIFDKNGIAQGGMHYLIINDDNKKYLALPGINPSQNFLGNVNADDLYNKMIDFAKESAKSIKADAVLMPTNSTIHSNRSTIQSIITQKNYEKMTLKKEHEFSFDPHKYSFQECYII